MLVAVADTHRRSGHGLEGRTATAVREAGAVIHAGDFTTPAVLEAFRETAGRLAAVAGNNDTGLDLPARRVLEAEGLRVAVVHGHDHGETALALLGREAGADLVVFGHSHRPTLVDADPPLLNPGSHATPRGGRAAHAEIGTGGDAARIRLVTPGGDVLEKRSV